MESGDGRGHAQAASRLPIRRLRLLLGVARPARPAAAPPEGALASRPKVATPKSSSSKARSQSGSQTGGVAGVAGHRLRSGETVQVGAEAEVGAALGQPSGRTSRPPRAKGVPRYLSGLTRTGGTSP